MSFGNIGAVLLVLQVLFAIAVFLSIEEARRRGSLVASTLYLVVALATIAWLWKAVQWLA